jgi:hypothetical protein
LRELYEETKNELKEIGQELGILYDSPATEHKELINDNVSVHTDV